jgi:hypothetical protein
VSNPKCLFLTPSLSLSLQFCLYRSSLIESSRKFYRNVYNPKCLFPSQNTDSLNKTCPTRNVCFTIPLSLSLSLSHSLSLAHSLSLSLQFCLDLSSFIESIRKQILLRKSYREQLRILSRAVANLVELYVSLYLSLCLSHSLSHTCAYLNKASTGSKLQTLSQETAVTECTAIYSL